jgi:hypothetical protein
MKKFTLSTAILVALAATSAIAADQERIAPSGLVMSYAPRWDSNCGLDTTNSEKAFVDAIVDSGVGLKLCNKGSYGDKARIKGSFGSVLAGAAYTDTVSLRFEGLTVENDDGAVNGTIRVEFYDTAVDAGNDTNGEEITCPPTKSGTVNGESGAGCWYTNSVLSEIRPSQDTLFNASSTPHLVFNMEAEGMGSNERLVFDAFRIIVDKSGTENDVDLSLNYK